MVSNSVANCLPKELAERILSSPRMVRNKNRQQLASAIKRFHVLSGRYDEGTEREIQKLVDGCHIVRLAHQPNFMPYDNLILQMRYLQLTKNAIELQGECAVIVVFFVDHDIGSNRRFQESIFFDPSSSVMFRPVRLPNIAKHRMIVDQPVPNQLFTDFLTHLYDRLTRSEAVKRVQSQGRIHTISTNRPQASLTHYTGFDWMSLATDFGVAPNLLFLSLADLHHHLKPFYVSIALEIGENHSGELNLWVICAACRGRKSVQHGSIGFRMRCTHCSSVSVTSSLMDPDWRVLPRVMVDNLSDYQALDVSGGTAYGAASVHIEQSLLVASQHGMLTGNEVAWRSDVLHAGTAGLKAFSRETHEKPSTYEKLALTTGRMGMWYYLSYPFELDDLIHEFDSSIYAGEVPERICVGKANQKVSRWLGESAE